eukprot:maker-scaffold172_size289735-snap-gene-1.32 protein:Tk06523 transcript:maker-scaffold172_size289735-snap-gene-1.32-mRNA-1 annotation:"nadph oxidase"
MAKTCPGGVGDDRVQDLRVQTFSGDETLDPGTLSQSVSGPSSEEYPPVYGIPEKRSLSHHRSTPNISSYSVFNAPQSVFPMEGRFTSRMFPMTKEMGHMNQIRPSMQWREEIIDRSSEGLSDPHVLFRQDNWVQRSKSTNLDSGEMRTLSQSRPELAFSRRQFVQTTLDVHRGGPSPSVPPQSMEDRELLRTIDYISLTPSQFQEQVNRNGSNPWNPGFQGKNRLLNAEELMKLFQFRRFLKSAGLSKKKFLRKVLDNRRLEAGCSTYDENGIRCTQRDIRLNSSPPKNCAVSKGMVFSTDSLGGEACPGRDAAVGRQNTAEGRQNTTNGRQNTATGAIPRPITWTEHPEAYTYRQGTASGPIDKGNHLGMAGRTRQMARQRHIRQRHIHRGRRMAGRGAEEGRQNTAEGQQNTAEGRQNTAEGRQNKAEGRQNPADVRQICPAAGAILKPITWTDHPEAYTYRQWTSLGPINRGIYLEATGLRDRGAVMRRNFVPDRLYQLVDRSTDGLVTADQVMEFIAGLQGNRPRSELTEENLKWLENVFRRSVGESGEIRLMDFKTIVNSKNPFFVERVFHIFDKDDNGSISLQEFIDAMHQFAGQSPDDKIKFLFKVYDIDGDGLIQEKELQHVMRACMDENGMNFDEGEVDDLTRALYHDATYLTKKMSAAGQLHQPYHPTNGITFEALKAQLTKHDGLLQNLTISIDRWLVPPKPKKAGSRWRTITSQVPHQFSIPYLRNNFQFLSFSFILLVINLGLFFGRLSEFKNFKNSNGTRNWWIMFARAGGQCLNFNSMFILVLMLRHSITKLREFGLNWLLPLDRHIYFHKVIGRLIFIFSLIHTVAHIGNLVVNSVPDPVGLLTANGIPLTLFNPPSPSNSSYSFAEWLFTSKPGLFGTVGGIANPTGVAILILFQIMFVCSMKWVRKGGYFEVFYWTHLLYVFYWVILILHAPAFWKWFIVPFILYLVEKVYRVGNSMSNKGKSWVTTGVVLPSRVVSLVIKRPPHFAFKPGDYIFINIPHIAMFEWHPFTISSAPEQTDTISLHIRVVGHWTSKLFEYFEAEQKRLAYAMQGATCQEPISKFERFQQTVTAAKERARKTSVILTGSSQRRESRRESRREDSLSGVSNPSFTGTPSLPSGSTPSGSNHEVESEENNNMTEVERNIRARMQKRDGIMRAREAELEKLEEEEDEELGEEAGKSGNGTKPGGSQTVARNFRYMRRKPTIISYKPPEADIYEEPGLEEIVACGSQECLNSESYILDRVVEKSGAESFEDGPKLHVVKKSRGYSSDNLIKLTKPLVVYIDGPFGAPTSQIFRAQHAVLIGTGIGVTPFASILQSIMHRYWQARNTCPKCHYTWTNDLTPSVLNLRKVDFFWINRDQRSFEWFVNLLSQLEIEQAEQGGAMERFLDMHMYITSALQKTDMKAVGLQLALDLLHKKSKRDLITGLKTRTNAGRPNWDKVFKQISEEKKGKVTVFFCGSPQLGKILKLKCDEYGFHYRKENF